MCNIELFTISSTSADIRESFNYLPNDDYTNAVHSFRQRRYSTAKAINNKMAWDEQPENFFQSEEHNIYVGGVYREFAPIDNTVKAFFTNHMLPKALKLLPDKAYDIGLHQIRTLSNNNAMGLPAPEGIHQDGFDYILVMCVNKNNITGGDSIILAADDHSNIQFDAILENNQCVLFNDRRYAHYASPIVPKLPGKGHRDVFVTTFRSAQHG